MKIFNRFFKKLSPKQYFWGILDALIERWREKYDFQFSIKLKGIGRTKDGAFLLEPDHFEIVINPEIVDRHPDTTINLDREGEED